jgi:hypothetical protein
VRWTSDGGERSSVAAICVELLGVRIGGKERRGVVSAVWRGGGGRIF